MKTLLESQLTDDKISLKGKYLVIELIEDHIQKDCNTVPRGTRGIITTFTKHGNVFLFPHSILNEEIISFSDGDIRIIQDRSKYKALGRICL